MSFAVCGGAVLQCTFGLVPSILNVLPVNKTINNMPLANIMDNQPMVNILSFGMCQSVSNPTVAAATAAAFGVLMPMPCIPFTTTPWTPGCSTVFIANKPALTDACQCMCGWGGIIKVNFAGQVTILIS